jgi:hypothetical protein
MSCAYRRRNPEIGHHRVAFTQQDVLGFDVSMDQVVAMRRAERIRNLAGEV